MRLTRHYSVLLSLLTLISVSVSYPHGSGLQDTGYLDKHQHPDSELCSSLRRYMDVLLRSTRVHCESFPGEAEDANLEPCSSSPSGSSIINCIEAHIKVSEVSECLLSSIDEDKSSTTSYPACLCRSISDSFMSLFNTSQMFCTKTFIDDLYNEHRDARVWKVVTDNPRCWMGFRFVNDNKRPINVNINI